MVATEPLVSWDVKFSNFILYFLKQSVRYVLVEELSKSSISFHNFSLQVAVVIFSFPHMMRRCFHRIF